MTQAASTLYQAYQQLIEQGDVHEDTEQLRIIAEMDTLLPTLSHYTPKFAQPFWNRIFNNSPPPKGLYIYGGVGRGKSMLMDLYFALLPTKHKRRVHFHAFMLEVHEALYKWRKHNKESNASHNNPLQDIAKQIAEQSWILCFDELQITDITDAMIVGRLFKALFELGVVVIATSNRHPDELYKDGLQRERFIPFITLIFNTMTILNLDSSTDYRLNRLQAMDTLYYTPLGKNATNFMQHTFDTLTNHATISTNTLHVQGRELTISHSVGDIAMLSFAELCEQPLGTADYMELASEYSTLLITDIPQMNADMRNEAKRFVTLIDTLYEHKVKLICSAEVSPEHLYISGTGAFEFERTASRLHEMQSRDYCCAEHV